jgi:hypothetical protein
MTKPKDGMLKPDRGMESESVPRYRSLTHQEQKEHALVLQNLCRIQHLVSILFEIIFAGVFRYVKMARLHFHNLDLSSNRTGSLWWMSFSLLFLQLFYTN